MVSAREFLGAEELGFVEAVAAGERVVAGAGPDALAFAGMLAGLLLEDDAASFEQALENDDAAAQACLAHEELRGIVLLGLSYGVACENAACANYLGALYYLGDAVPLDYRRAQELYEAAEAGGLVQAMVNLGYIYEYGRLGEPDYARAYQQYAKAAALSGHFEALYKLGDLYARGHGVELDLRTALALWDRSLRAAEGEAAQAQPAFRIARLIGDAANAEVGLPYDPLGALRLFQLAERGLRVSVARGETYYRPRLLEAIEGQTRVRALLDGPGGAAFVL